jgi:predicted nuclease of restriction endonuclease-like (RecB) superfamily
MAELVIPIENLSSRGFINERREENMEVAIASMVGEQPRCLFFNGELRVTFTPEQFDRIKSFYHRKWRSNVTHEIKRHCAINGYKPILGKMVINK